MDNVNKAADEAARLLRMGVQFRAAIEAATTYYPHISPWLVEQELTKRSAARAARLRERRKQERYQKKLEV